MSDQRRRLPPTAGANVGPSVQRVSQTSNTSAPRALLFGNTLIATRTCDPGTRAALRAAAPLLAGIAGRSAAAPAVCRLWPSNTKATDVRVRSPAAIVPAHRSTWGRRPRRSDGVSAGVPLALPHSNRSPAPRSRADAVACMLAGRSGDALPCCCSRSTPRPFSLCCGATTARRAR